MKEEKRPFPEGWVSSTLGGIRTDSSKSITPNKQPDTLFELYSVPSYNELLPETVLGKDIGSSKRIVAPNSVLLCKINPRINRVWLVGDHTTHPKIASTEWIPFDEVEGILPKYLQYFMQQNTFRDFLAQHASGVGGSLMRVKASTFADFIFPIAPTVEQKRIVAEIEKQFTRLDQAVASLKRAQANLQRYKASVLKAACEGSLVPQDPNDEPAEILLQRILAERRRQWEEQEWGKLVIKAQKKVAQARRKAQGLPARLSDLEPEEWQDIPEAEYGRYLPRNDKWKDKYKEPSAPETAELPPLPEGWIWATMEQIAIVIGGLTKNSKRNQLDMKMPYLRVANVYANRLELDDIATIGVTESELDRILLEPDDLLIVEGNGSIEQIGRVSIWDGSIEPCVHQNHIIKARLLDKSVADFTLYWLLSIGGRNAIT